MGERAPDNDEWIEKVVKVAGALGLSPMRTRWKLIRWQERRRQAARRREQVLDHIRYEHKTCEACGAIQDRAARTCSRCEARLGRRELQVLRRIGLASPVALSVSTLLALALLGVYVRVLLAGSAGSISPTIGALLAFGGHWPPAVAEEPWRLVTSMFLHGSLWHLGFNLLALATVGPRVEAAYGRLSMLGLVLATGTLANVGSGLVGLDGVGVGASGGIMGLIGALAGQGQREGTWAGRTQRDDMLKWVAYTFVFGLFVGADHAAHLFGAVLGAAFGYAVRPARWRASVFAPLRLPLGLVGVVVAIGAVVVIFTRTAPVGTEDAELAETAETADPSERAVRAALAELAEAGPVDEDALHEEYARYAEACRLQLAGDAAGARRALASVVAEEVRDAISLESLCNTALHFRALCREGMSSELESPDADSDARATCAAVERAFGELEDPRPVE